MRLSTLRQPILIETTAHALSFQSERGEAFRITVLEEDLIRVQYLPDGAPRLDRTWMVVGHEGDCPREGRQRDDLSPFSLPAFTLDVRDELISMQTQQLRVEIARRDFRLLWFDARARQFAADLSGRGYASDRSNHAVYHYLERRADERYYGFGERAGALDKRGRRMRMLNVDALGYDAETSDPLYKHFPFYITFIPDLQIAYGLFYDNLASCTFDLGQEIDAYHGAYRYYQADDGDIDYYLIYGPSIAQVVEKFAALTGRMHLPPRWSLGYLASTMKYTDAPDAQAQLARFVELCREHAIPCDLFHLSSGYSADPDGKRNVFTWNRDRVPDPPQMVETFHRAGIKVAANIKPCLLTTHPRYEQVAALGAFILSAERNGPEVSAFWGGAGSYLDFTNPICYDWWKAGVQEQLLEYGIDSTWNDNNEYEIWDDDARANGFGNALRVGLIRPLLALLMTRASYEAQQAFRPDERPFLITRSGCPGIQRYAQTWSGDNTTSWQTLRYNIPMGLGLGLSGVANTGHDVGGFTGYKPSPELFVRWVQNGIFHPRFTLHSWHLDGSVNEPWMYPEVLPIVRAAIEFRYRLIPYLYSLFFESAQTGHPIVRPLVYEFPEDALTHTESFDFLLGPNLLVASVLEDGARTRSAHLPGKGDWCDFYSGEWHRGGETINADAPLEHVPLFVPAGGMIPMGKAMRFVGEQADDLRQVYSFPHRTRGSGSFTLIEDDGASLGYRRGEYTQVTLTVSAEPEEIELQVSVRGNYSLPYDRIEFILPRGEARRIRGTRVRESAYDAEGRQHVWVVVK